MPRQPDRRHQEIAQGHRKPLNDLSADNYGPVETRQGPDDDEPDNGTAGAPAPGLGFRGGLPRLPRLPRLPGHDNYPLLILAGQLVRAASVTGRLANDGVVELFQTSPDFTQPPTNPTMIAASGPSHS